jgi:hypothetical protein
MIVLRLFVSALKVPAQVKLLVASIMKRFGPRKGDKSKIDVHGILDQESLWLTRTDFDEIELSNREPSRVQYV